MHPLGSCNHRSGCALATYWLVKSPLRVIVMPSFRRCMPQIAADECMSCSTTPVSRILLLTHQQYLQRLPCNEAKRDDNKCGLVHA